MSTQRTDEIELTTGVTIMVKASDFGGVRAPTIACVVADEIAFWPSHGANPIDEVLSAIRPAMATIPDAKLLCISTGYAQVGALYDAHKEHFGKDDDEVLIWQSTPPLTGQMWFDSFDKSVDIPVKIRVRTDLNAIAVCERP